MTRLLVLGDGKMGTAVAALAPEHGFEVVAMLGAAQTAGGLAKADTNGAEVAIEFTVPSAAPALIRACADLAIPVVSGTTGWEPERPAVERHLDATAGALLWAPNFSLGVHLFAKVVAEAAKRFAHPAAAFDAHLVETHHAQKLDAPSGTAKMLAGAAAKAGGRAMPITSIRTGAVPGTHEVVLDAAFEQVRLVHEARDRRVFAAGALAAARWILGRRGIFTLDDLFGEAPR